MPRSSTRRSAVLALAAAGSSPPRRRDQWLLDAQCPDGGWPYDAPYAPGDGRRALRPRVRRTTSSPPTRTRRRTSCRRWRPRAHVRVHRRPVRVLRRDPRPGQATVGRYTSAFSDRRELDRAGDPGLHRRRRAGPGRRRSERCAHCSIRRAAAGPTPGTATRRATRTWAPRSARCSASCQQPLPLARDGRGAGAGDPGLRIA